MSGAAVVDRRGFPGGALEGRRRRRNVQLFLVHVAIALAFLAAFVWAQVHR